MSRVKLVNVIKRFGKIIALDKVSFNVDDSEFFALVGPSGSGKTTVLRIIAGLETPDEGDVYIDDLLVNYVHPKDRDVAMVFQNYALYPHMTVFENIAFSLMSRRRELGLTKDDVVKRVSETARLLQIENLLERYPHQLSGGQQQRVALARALVRKPKVWLLDEPLSNLDAKLRLQMRAEVKKLQRELKITTVYVTHDQIEAMSMADKIAVMNLGKILQIGTPDDLYYKPKDVFVATFIGSPPMNIIPCEYFTNETMNVILKGPGFIKIFDKDLSTHIIKEAKSSEILVGIRPEHIKIHKNRESESDIEAKILLSEPLGSEQIIMIDLEGTII
ncbi:MAG: ABC transporter ATP-binding protein, partial [Thermoprotei archaeon]